MLLTSACYCPITASDWRKHQHRLPPSKAAASFFGDQGRCWVLGIRTMKADERQRDQGLRNLVSKGQCQPSCSQAGAPLVNYGHGLDQFHLQHLPIRRTYFIILLWGLNKIPLIWLTLLPINKSLSINAITKNVSVLQKQKSQKESAL